jgi:hypothetical protein
MKKIIVASAIIVILVVVLSLSIVLFLGVSTDNVDNYSDMTLTTEPFLWKIDGENPSYLYGSIHVPSKEILTIPSVVIDAFNEADVVYTETKLDEDTQTQILYSSLLTGTTLENLLPDDVEQRLSNYLNNKGYTLDLFSQYKIWTMISTITLLDEIAIISQYDPLDQYIWDMATTGGKITGGIEKYNEQISIFDDLTIDQQITLLNSTLDELEDYVAQGKNIADDYKTAYINGNLAALNALLIADYDETNPIDVLLWDRLITDRNINMSNRIAENITNNPNTQYFFTIGSGHYYGDDGILNLLTEKGFTVTRVEFNECTSCNVNYEMINGRCYLPYE